MRWAFGSVEGGRPWVAHDRYPRRVLRLPRHRLFDRAEVRPPRFRPSGRRVRAVALIAALAVAGCSQGSGVQTGGPLGGGNLPVLGGPPLASNPGGGGNPGGGAPVVLGPQLSTPTNSVTCQDGYPIQTNATFPQPFYLQGAQSCLLLTFFPGAQPPGSGVVVSANIAIGAVTGPMRFVRMRILSQEVTGTACCSVEQYGEVFTPAPNQITTVPLGFTMTFDTLPGPTAGAGIITNDLIGLEILAPNVPIPGTWTRNGGGDLGLPDYIWLPALSARGMGAPTNNLRSEGSFSGFLPSYNMNFVPVTR